jgi:lysophospholipid acyltransferase (LPLAT)-like uncharacterized protein
MMVGRLAREAKPQAAFSCVHCLLPTAYCPMKIRSPTLMSLGGFLAATMMRSWMSRLDYKAAFFDRRVDPGHSTCSGRKIFVFWHEYILFPIFLESLTSVAVLLSRHGDADVLTHLVSHFRLNAVRGSTRRGGMAATRELTRKGGRMHLVITPDGPRGPRRRMALGPVFLASKLGIPVVAIGFGCDRPWRIKGAWDQFAIPRPYSRARAVVSPEIMVPQGLDRKGLEHFRQRIEALMNRFCDEADAWAASGAVWQDQVKVTFRSNERLQKRYDR